MSVAVAPREASTPPGSIGVFDRLYDESDDPWGTHVRWYERRKRALLMASLPQERYGSIYEAGCGTGHASVELAARADELVASDASMRAVALATTALAGHSNAVVERHVLPEHWPRRRFDLVVLGEVLYFVDPIACAAIADAARTSAGADGTIVACHWRLPIDGFGQSGEQAHRRFEDALALPRLFEYLDDDFVLSGWSAATRSVAEAEGLR